MILSYAARNALTPKASPQHIAQFEQMAHKENPGLAADMPHFQNVGSQIAQRIDTLDPERRRLAHDDLNQNILGHVSSALASGKTAAAVQAIRGHLQKLAQQHGVQIPQMGAPAAGGVGGLKPPGM